MFKWGLKCFLLFYIIFSCTENDRSVLSKSYTQYSSQNGNWKSKRINQFFGDINYTATEVPLQYYISKSIGDDSRKIDSIYNLNKKERIIEIEFTHANEDDLLKSEYTKKSYDNAVKYMAFTIKKDFNIVTSSKDTIKCSGVNFERNFKVGPFKRAMLYFNNINPDDNIKLIYQDHLFGNGIIKFNFDELPLKI